MKCSKTALFSVFRLMRSDSLPKNHLLPSHTERINDRRIIKFKTFKVREIDTLSIVRTNDLCIRRNFSQSLIFISAIYWEIEAIESYSLNTNTYWILQCDNSALNLESLREINDKISILHLTFIVILVTTVNTKFFTQPLFLRINPKLYFLLNMINT